MLLSWRQPEAANQIEGRLSPLVFSLRNGIARQAGRPTRRDQHGFSRDREIYPDDSLVIAEWQEPAGSDRLPVHRSESPTGYSSTGCSPAEPASASPVTNDCNPSGSGIKCTYSTGVQR